MSQSKKDLAYAAWAKASLIAAEEVSRRNPSRYTHEGYLKPICAEGRHKPLKDALACEVCGSAVFGPGSDVRH